MLLPSVLCKIFCFQYPLNSHASALERKSILSAFRPMWWVIEQVRNGCTTAVAQIKHAPVSQESARGEKVWRGEERQLHAETHSPSVRSLVTRQVETRQTQIKHASFRPEDGDEWKSSLSLNYRTDNNNTHLIFTTEKRHSTRNNVTQRYKTKKVRQRK